jgi:quercetin dioxygenase-like cupin family protein
LRLSLYERPSGAETVAGNRVVFDLERGEAFFGAATVEGPAILWELEEEDAGALLSRAVELDPATPWIARCDRVDFPRGAIAYTHVHPGPGIRYVLFGEFEIRTEGEVATYGPGTAWFERGPDPVYAVAGPESAFVRVLLLPAEWEGKRTVRYIDPADDDKPRLQRPTVFFDHPLELG